ncbi:YraN family protein [Thermovenabulum sp.]|uniref:YraN family protein n=1 Tax=Thermovenabulum sp. TaxID=3100335 RepID=UPI003C7B79A1
MDNKILGKAGEDYAKKYLISKNFIILATNYRCKFGEIDIVAKDKENNIVFFEVKARNSDNFGRGFEAVDFFKQQRIRKTALIFLGENKQYFNSIRFDVIDILVSKGKTLDLLHFENAF